MALLLKFCIFFCTSILYSASYCVPVEGRDYKIADPSLSTFCADLSREYSSRKIICLICKGFDPSCFYKTTTTTTTTTTTDPTTTTTEITSTSSKTTTAKQSSSTATGVPPPAPATRADEDAEEEDGSEK